LGAFISYKENEVLSIPPQALLALQTSHTILLYKEVSSTEPSFPFGEGFPDCELPVVQLEEIAVAVPLVAVKSQVSAGKNEPV
jgi:hypothetical protein